jgi:hypothetical protein
MAQSETRRRLADLLIDPRESPEVEVKGWLDLADSKEDRATLAKALLALANHGGGFVLLGLTETDTGIVPASPRPATLNAYSQDEINGTVQSYADPPFHCEVHHVPGPDGSIHPIIVVPGGHRVPIRAKRGGPGNTTVQQHAVYVRRPGPKSETPQNAQDWDELFARCLAARRDELLDRVRDLLTGVSATSSMAGASEGSVTPGAAQGARLAEWVNACTARWRALVEPLPADDPRRCPLGHYWFAYELRGDLRRVGGAAFLELLTRSVVRHTGWPPWWVPTRGAIAPYICDGAVECWLGREDDRRFPDPAHSDLWRVSPDGLAFLLRGYDEDGPSVSHRGFEPGRVFDISAPIWNVGEALLHAERFASNMADGPTTIAFQAHYDGLDGRQLADVEGRRGGIWPGRISHQSAISVGTIIEAQSVSANLPEIVHGLLEPLYALFDFFPLHLGHVQTELARLRERQR